MAPRLRPLVQSLSLRGALPQPSSLLACKQQPGEHAAGTPQNATASRLGRPPPEQKAACTPQKTDSSDDPARREVCASRGTRWAVGAARRRTLGWVGGAVSDDCSLPASFLSEAKPGGRLHLKARQRLFALAAGGAHPTSACSEAMTSGHADTPKAGLAQDIESAAPVPLMQHRPAAARKRQLRSARGALVRALSLHALLVHGTPAERAGVYRHLKGEEEVGGSTHLNRRLYRAELKAYLRFLVSHLPSLELQALLAVFTEANLDAMATEQMEELLQLLHLGERAEDGGHQGFPAPRSSSSGRCCGSAAKPPAPSIRLQQKQAAGHSPDPQEGLSTSCGPELQQLQSSSSSISGTSSTASGRSCSGGSSLTSEALLRILRCTDTSQSACLPPCLKANTALRQLLLFIHREHPMLGSLEISSPKVTPSAHCMHKS
ncbi:hypothetical protein ACSSS7_005506 [Eimeria intestinalis]